MFSVVYKTVRIRRSVHRYLSKDVADDVLWRILDAARWAPSAHNAQPWRFVVIKDPAIKLKLAEAMAKEWDKNMDEDSVPLKDRNRLIRASIEQFTHPPTLIIVCLTMEDMDMYLDKRRQMAEYVMAIQSVAAGIQNLLLAADAEGLGTCWFCAPLFCPETVRETLDIPEQITPQALVTLGYPAEEPKAPPRKPLEKVVFKKY